MKAITCTQCGATIEDVSERSVIIDCGYCGARIMLEARRETEPVASIEAPDLEFEAPVSSMGPTQLTAAAIGVLVPILLIVILFARAPTKPSPSSSPTYQAWSSPSAYPTPSSWNWNSATGVPGKPVPVVNYQPRVSWDGPNDLEHFADPQVDLESVQDLTTEEVKKTVFKNRVVKLRVVINTEGEIDEVETISGHPILVAAATESAKSSIFRSRTKPTTRVLTYTFRVLKD